MIIKNLLTILSVLFLVSCGFKPIYKVAETQQDLLAFEISFNNPNQISSNIKDEINQILISDRKSNYNINMTVEEDRVPLIINTNGTVAKYRVSVIISFVLREIENKNIIIEDSVRGQAQEDVTSSEIDNEDKRIQMVSSATNDAMQIMMSKILSSISANNDY